MDSPNPPPRISLKSSTQNSSQTGSTLFCQICKKSGHHALKCWHLFDNSYQDDQVPQALATLQLNSSTEGEWVLDTGATAHITDDPSNFSTLESYDGPNFVMVGNVRNCLLLILVKLMFLHRVLLSH